MKKLENFSWQMWQIYALAALVVFIVGGACSFFFVKEATYVVKERNYVYKGKNLRLTNYVTIGENEPEFPMIALSFKEDDNERGSSVFAVGRKYLAVQDSKQYDGTLKKKDKEEYFRIRYYQLGQEKGEGHTIDALKLVQDMGYVSINGELDNQMYSDGKNDYVKIQIDYDNEIYINLTNKKATKKRPKETIQFGYGGIYRALSDPSFITEAYSDDESNIHSYGPWFKYEKDDKESISTGNSSDKNHSSSNVKTEDNVTLATLKKYGYLLVLKENMTLDDSETLTKILYPDASYFHWTIDSRYTKTGRKEYVETDQEFKQVIKEDAIEKDIED